MPGDPSSRQTVRGRWQFGLRTCLVIFSVAIVATGWLALRLQRHWADERARVAIERLGGRVLPVPARAGPQGSQREAGVRVYLAGPQITDEVLADVAHHLPHLRHLRQVDLVLTSATDAGLLHLRRWPLVEEIYLFQNQFSDKAIDQLSAALPATAIRQENPDPIASGLAMRPIHRHAVTRIVFSPDGARLAAGTGDGVLTVWSRAAFDVEFQVAAHSDWLFGVAFHPSGQFVATGGGDDLIRVWSLQSRRCLAVLAGHTDDVHAVEFTPDGLRLVSASDDATLRVWDFSGWPFTLAELERHEASSPVALEAPVLHVLRGHTGSIPALAIDPAGRLAASASRDATLRLWDLEAGRLVAILAGHDDDVMTVAFNQRGDRLASGGYDRAMRIWDVAAASTLACDDRFADWVFGVAFHPHGEQWAAVDGSGVLTIASARQRRAVWIPETPSAVAYSPDGRWLVAGSTTGLLHVFDAVDLASIGELATLYAPRPAALSRPHQDIAARLRPATIPATETGTPRR